jgi:hypothetical protein
MSAGMIVGLNEIDGALWTIKATARSKEKSLTEH